MTAPTNTADLAVTAFFTDGGLEGAHANGAVTIDEFPFGILPADISTAVPELHLVADYANWLMVQGIATTVWINGIPTVIDVGALSDTSGHSTALARIAAASVAHTAYSDYSTYTNQDFLPLRIGVTARLTDINSSPLFTIAGFLQQRLLLNAPYNPTFTLINEATVGFAVGLSGQVPVFTWPQDTDQNGTISSAEFIPNVVVRMALPPGAKVGDGWSITTPTGTQTGVVTQTQLDSLYVPVSFTVAQQPTASTYRVHGYLSRVVDGVAQLGPQGHGSIVVAAQTPLPAPIVSFPDDVNGDGVITSSEFQSPTMVVFTIPPGTQVGDSWVLSNNASQGRSGVVGPLDMAAGQISITVAVARSAIGVTITPPVYPNSGYAPTDLTNLATQASYVLTATAVFTHGTVQGYPGTGTVTYAPTFEVDNVVLSEAGPTVQLEGRGGVILLEGPALVIPPPVVSCPTDSNLDGVITIDEFNPVCQLRLSVPTGVALGYDWLATITSVTSLDVSSTARYVGTVSYADLANGYVTVLFPLSPLLPDGSFTVSAFYGYNGSRSVNGTLALSLSTAIAAPVITFPADLNHDGIIEGGEFVNPMLVQMTVPAGVAAGDPWIADVGQYGIHTGTVTTTDISNGYVLFSISILSPFPAPEITYPQDINADGNISPDEYTTPLTVRIALPAGVYAGAQLDGAISVNGVVDTTLTYTITQADVDFGSVHFNLPVVPRATVFSTTAQIDQAATPGAASTATVYVAPAIYTSTLYPLIAHDGIAVSSTPESGTFYPLPSWVDGVTMGTGVTAGTFTQLVSYGTVVAPGDGVAISGGITRGSLTTVTSYGSVAMSGDGVVLNHGVSAGTFESIVITASMPPDGIAVDHGVLGGTFGP